MAAKKSNRSPFNLFLMKMQRMDRSLRSKGMSQLIAECNDKYKSLDTSVSVQFRLLSNRARNEVLTDTDLNRALDAIDFNSNGSHNGPKGSAEEESWDQTVQSDGASNEVMVGFQFSRYADTQADSRSDTELATDFDSLRQRLQRWPDLWQKRVVCICFNVIVLTDEGVYYPIEVGLTEFSLEDGVQKAYTRLIANTYPEGYYTKAKEFSDQYHKLPITVAKEDLNFERDYEKLFEEIYGFLSNTGLFDIETNERLVFCKTVDHQSAEDAPQVMGCLKWLDDKMRELRVNTSGRSLANDFRVFDLSELLFLMSSKYSETGVKAKALCIDALSSSKFDYNPDMNCPFHDALPIENLYCALGVTKRMAYLFLDSMFSTALVPELDLKPTDAHRPKKFVCNSEFKIHRFPEQSHPSTRSYGYPSQSYRPYFDANQNQPPVMSRTNPNTSAKQPTGLGRGRFGPHKK